MQCALRVWLGIPHGGGNDAVVLRGGTGVMESGGANPQRLLLPPTGSDQPATNGMDHRLEAVVRAELLIDVVQVIAKGLR